MRPRKMASGLVVLEEEKEEENEEGEEDEEEVWKSCQSLDYCGTASGGYLMLYMTKKPEIIFCGPYALTMTTPS